MLTLTNNPKKLQGLLKRHKWPLKKDHYVPPNSCSSVKSGFSSHLIHINFSFTSNFAMGRIPQSLQSTAHGVAPLVRQRPRNFRVRCKLELPTTRHPKLWKLLMFVNREFIQIGTCLVVTLIILHLIHITSDFFRFPDNLFMLEPTDILKTTPRPFSPVIPLYSRLDFWGLFHTIEFLNVSTFNPALLTLPYAGECRNGTFVVVAREEYQFKWIDGVMVQPRTIVASLLHVATSSPERRWAPRDSPRIQSHSLERLDQLVHSNATYFPKCEPDPERLFSTIQGPEDPRLIWSHLGEPLMIYSSTSPENSDLCRHFYLVDLRSVYHVVADIISETAEPAPMRFSESLPIAYPGQEGLHKNWAPFTNPAGDVFVHVHLVPQTIYKVKLGSSSSPPTFSSPDNLVSLEPIVRHPPEDENCLTIALNDFPRQEIHQSTPFLDVLLCRSADVHSGLCDPNDPNNHVYMGVIHAQHLIQDTRYYETRIVTLNFSLPFNYISISKPMLYCTTLLLAKYSLFAN